MLAKVFTHLHAFSLRTLDLLLPPQCPMCKSPTSTAHGICGQCWNKLTFITDPYCKCCGNPFEISQTDDDETTCVVCLKTPPTYDQARAALVYNDNSRRLIVPFKHSDRTSILPILVKMLKQSGNNILQEADLYIPVPLHWQRLLKRRYNQAALLCTELGKTYDKPVLTNTLRRVKSTPPQAGLSRKQRQKNVRTAFHVKHPETISGKHVLLIDDVITTGATVEACAKALKKAGAKRVSVLTVARVNHIQQIL